MRHRYQLTAFIVCLLIFRAGAQAQSVKEDYTFLAPRPGAVLVPTSTGIVVRPGGKLGISADDLRNLITVTGSVSGAHTGSVRIADDGETFVFQPDVPFALGEEVSVEVRHGVRFADGSLAGEKRYCFVTSATAVRRHERAVPAYPSALEFREGGLDGVSPATGHQSLSAQQRTLRPQVSSVTAAADDLYLPKDFPTYDVTHVDDPEEGYLFIAPFQWPTVGVTPQRPYLLILDNDGTPIFYRRTTGTAFDFKVQPNGHITYFEGSSYVELDDGYRKVNEWSMKNGYETDFHDLQLLPNGHALLMSYDVQPVDMSQVVPGGRPDAMVTGFVIQEQDASHNVVFEWRSWDHFEITDAVARIDLTAREIDYVHGNAFELDSDGNIMISSRHMDEITKIDRSTGEIIWRMGGENNEFTFENDTLGFSHQHDIRRLKNGNVSLFDNGNGHIPPRSRVVEYELDETSKTARLVWSYPESPALYSLAMANAQQLPRGNTMIGWGYTTAGARKLGATEVRPDGSKAFEIVLDTGVVSYRTFRFPWSGRSAAPYLWIEDMDSAITDSVVLFMEIFGRDDVEGYNIYMEKSPEGEQFLEMTAGDSLIVRGLERGVTYFFRATGVTAGGGETEFSERLRFTVLPRGPRLTVRPQTISFPPTGVGSTSSIDIDGLIVNEGEEPLAIESFALGGENVAEFTAEPARALPQTLPPGDSLGVTVTFAPEEMGFRAARLTIHSNSMGNTSIDVPMQGVADQPRIEGKSEVDFGDAAPGSSVDSTISGLICNPGQVPITVMSIELESDAFQLLPGRPALPAVLPPGQCLDVALRFAPVDDGEVFDTLHVVSTATPDRLPVRLIGNGSVSSAPLAETGARTVTVAPNPTRGDLTIELAPDHPATTSVEIYDAAGRLVRSFGEKRHVPGRHAITWDGRDTHGARCPSGHYVARVRIDDVETRVPFVVER